MSILVFLFQTYLKGKKLPSLLGSNEERDCHILTSCQSCSSEHALKCSALCVLSWPPGDEVPYQLITEHSTKSQPHPYSAVGVKAPFPFRHWWSQKLLSFKEDEKSVCSVGLFLILSLLSLNTCCNDLLKNRVIWHCFEVHAVFKVLTFNSHVVSLSSLVLIINIIAMHPYFLLNLITENVIALWKQYMSFQT